MPERAPCSPRLPLLALGMAALIGFDVAHLSGQAAPDPSAVLEIELPADLDRVLRDYEAAWQARDPDGLAALFAPDGFVLRGGHPPVRGRDGIRVAYATSGGPLHLIAYAFAVDGDVAWIVGGYSSGPDSPAGGKYVLALVRGPDGRWLIAADMDNGNG